MNTLNLMTYFFINLNIYFKKLLHYYTAYKFYYIRKNFSLITAIVLYSIITFIFNSQYTSVTCQRILVLYKTMLIYITL